AATDTRLASAIPTLNIRSGYLSPNFFVLSESGVSPPTQTILGSSLPSSTRVSAYAPLMSAVFFSLLNSMELFLYPKLICVWNQYMFTGFHPIGPYVELSRVVEKPFLKRDSCLVPELYDRAVNVP